MIAWLALLAAAAPNVAPPEDTIVVLGRQLEATRFMWNAVPEGKAWRIQYCRVVKSGGDAEVDAIACPAIETCLPRLGMPGKKVPKAFQQCLFETRRALLSALADRRADAAAASSEQPTS
ncbi:MAG: hypothetical protein ACKOQM_07890 [Novosphingobium sp.]